jgi:hypothetical protein
MTRIYRVLSCIDASDGVHRVTIEESDGLFRFVASIFISESDVEDGEAYKLLAIDPMVWSLP